jgi:hypothetical protein
VSSEEIARDKTKIMMNPMMNPMNPMGMFIPPSEDHCSCHGLTTHKVPRIPIMIDESKEDPRSVREFTGKPLHTVVDDDALNGKNLQIFTCRDKAESFAKSLRPKKRNIERSPKKSSDQVSVAQYALTAGIPPDGGYIELYEDVEFGGCSWRLLEYNRHAAGNYANLWSCGFLFWGWKNADNRISSMDVRLSADLVTFFDLPNLNFAGSTMWMSGDSWVPSLVPLGWNDRISSHLFWYF